MSILVPPAAAATCGPARCARRLLAAPSLPRADASLERPPRATDFLPTLLGTLRTSRTRHDWRFRPVALLLSPWATPAPAQLPKPEAGSRAGRLPASRPVPSGTVASWSASRTASSSTATPPGVLLHVTPRHTTSRPEGKADSRRIGTRTAVTLARGPVALKEGPGRARRRRDGVRTCLGQVRGWSCLSCSPCGKKKAGSQYRAGNPSEKLLFSSVGLWDLGLGDETECFQAVMNLMYLSEQTAGRVVKGVIGTRFRLSERVPPAPPSLLPSFSSQLSPTWAACPVF